MNRTRAIKSKWNGIDKKDISALDISWLIERSERVIKLEKTLSDVHWLLLEATNAYTKNCDFKVNYKINEAITLIEELARDEGN
ncbi:hypothetical protein BKP37_12805 [Anaerobacillus alkalilacustris]|uniref:Uncharacterized protein n=1 Tax=Anaerobacillus alkalilacustris TaxID=393763 RepID=A0A1S2LJX5_9BACI|nr:hypothetical protein [Anaerobacillus alkalilacustris]OIJ12676.1 hypothetical protein BKP37_12805 [Anaerobacillus alkalilacustris]